MPAETGFEYWVEKNKDKIEQDGIKIFEMNGRHAFTGPGGRTAYFYKGLYKFGFQVEDDEKHLYKALREFREKLGLPLLREDGI